MSDAKVSPCKGSLQLRSHSQPNSKLSVSLVTWSMDDILIDWIINTARQIMSALALITTKTRECSGLVACAGITSAHSLLPKQGRNNFGHTSHIWIMHRTVFWQCSFLSDTSTRPNMEKVSGLWMFHKGQRELEKSGNRKWFPNVKSPTPCILIWGCFGH